MHLGSYRDADGGDPGNDEKDAGQPGHTGTQAYGAAGRRGVPGLRPGHDHAKPGYTPPVHLPHMRPLLRLPQGVLLA